MPDTCPMNEFQCEGERILGPDSPLEVCTFVIGQRDSPASLGVMITDPRTGDVLQVQTPDRQATLSVAAASTAIREGVEWVGAPMGSGDSLPHHAAAWLYTRRGGMGTRVPCGIPLAKSPSFQWPARSSTFISLLSGTR